jgi:hypothetical protein
MAKIDLGQLEREMRSWTPQQGLFKVVRKVLMEQGRWRNLPRGNPSKGYKVMKENKKKANA